MTGIANERFGVTPSGATVAADRHRGPDGE
jgi:hypothetical protein